MPRTPSSPFRRRLPWQSLLSTATLLSTSWLPHAQAQASAQKSAADYFVHSLPGAPSPLLKMYAGHIEVTPEDNGNLFFWFFQNRHIANRQRTVIWFNGGPGCSSMDGALMEIGPYRVQEDGTLRYNEGSWDEFSNVLFIDNPVGTGFSYVNGDKLVHDLPVMAEQMVKFLETWFAIFPEYMHDDLYIAGESYAGQHIPYMAQGIVDRNALKPAHESWNLTGLMIGNGWISGPEQYLSYVPFAYESGIMKSGSDADKHALRQQKECVKALENGGKDKVEVGTCEAIMQGIMRDTERDGKCINMYDTRLTDSYPSCGMNWPPDLSSVTPYLHREDVTRALNINRDKQTGWRECNDQVNQAFNARNSKPAVTLLPALLEKMPIILFSGDQDFICNHIGTENLISKLEWNGARGMETQAGMTAPKRDWTFEGEPAGQWQTARNLTYIRFYNSSHMVPFDYPRRTRDMLDRFIGVDIASIGGTPADSRIDGEKGLETSVGGHPNSTVAEEQQKDSISAATWAAYRRSGEVALVVVLIVVGVWAYFVWRDRRRRRGYKGVLGSDPFDGPGNSGLGLDGAAFSSSSRSKRRREERDIEAAAAFDEAELDELTADGGQREKSGRERFGLEDDGDEGGGYGGRVANGHVS